MRSAVNASPKAWAIRLAASSIACAAFVIATAVAKGTGNNDWGAALNTLWIAALVLAVIASLAAPIAALRSSLGPRGRVLVFACSLPALLLVAFLVYFFVVILPRIA